MLMCRMRVLRPGNDLSRTSFSTAFVISRPAMRDLLPYHMVWQEILLKSLIEIYLIACMCHCRDYDSIRSAYAIRRMKLDKM